MTITIDNADPILGKAKKLARKEGATLKALVERGLTQVLAERRRGEPFRLRDVSFGGEGMQAGVQGLSRKRIRDLSYEGRGG